MIKSYNNMSLAIAIPGLIMQFVGRIMMGGEQATLGLAMTLLGTVMLLVGFAYYAKAKGRSPVWCLAAFLWIIGLVILALLKDKSGVDEVNEFFGDLRKRAWIERWSDLVTHHRSESQLTDRSTGAAVGRMF